MHILWIAWKDASHPEAGGAEVVSKELCERLVAGGHQVTLLTADYHGARPDGHVPGVTVLRAGKSRYTHPFRALLFYIRQLRNIYDVLIEEVEGGTPYFSVFFERRAKRFVLYHQLARVNWLYEIKKPFSYVGYLLLVPVATWLLSRSKVPVITVSESTRGELAKFGWAGQQMHIISEGIQITPVATLPNNKYNRPTVLSHGSMRAMKRTIDQIKAFEHAKKQIPDLQLKISGSSNSTYGREVMAYIEQSPYRADIEYLGLTTDAQKTALMRKCHLILVTSVEEGWGLIVTEANSQGTPAVVYDVHGLRDSVRNGETGVVTKPSPEALARGISETLHDKAAYEQMRHNAWEWSKAITFEQAYEDFSGIIGKEQA